MEFEANIIRFFQLNTSVGFVTFFNFITLFGGLVGGIITFIILFFNNKKLSYIFLITFAIASILNTILKSIIARERPFEIYKDIINYGNEDGFSMPSGHSMSASLYATFLFYLNLKSKKSNYTKFICGICLFIFVGLIAMSRMVLGVHFLTDTLAGIIEGFLLAFTACFVYNKLSKKSINKGFLK